MTTSMQAAIGASIEEVDTPCLVVDLDAFERNVAVMRGFIDKHGLRLRAHAKTHKSSDIALYQIEKGGACGICCQKVSEAEALVNAGIRDVLISNEVVAPRMIERLAVMASRARVLVCVDDLNNVDHLSSAAQKHRGTIECLVEIDIGAGRCGVAPGVAALEIAKKINAAPGLKFAGLQAYHGPAQHIVEFAERKRVIGAATDTTAKTVELLKGEGLECDIVAGAGTGTYWMEGTSGVYNELQCGSYIFMDASYQRLRDEQGYPVREFGNSLFVYSSIMSKTKNDQAICDAGLKALSVDSGMPVIYGRTDVGYAKCSDEHGIISDPNNVLKLNEKLMLIPGHCDPTVNLYDWYVGIRNNRVETLWPVTARGKMV
jgi:3-hydroxy-D-aspartate aldolase